MNALPHGLVALLLDLGRQGIELAPFAAVAPRLRHRPAVQPPAVSSRLRMHRAAVLGLLAGEHVPADDEARYVLDERLGVADGLGMPTHAGSPAWLLAVGESLGSERLTMGKYRVVCHYVEIGGCDSGGDAAG